MYGISKESAERTALKYHLPIGEIRYIFSMPLGEIKRYYDYMRGANTRKLPILKHRFKLRMDLIRDSFPVNEIELGEE